MYQMHVYTRIELYILVVLVVVFECVHACVHECICSIRGHLEDEPTQPGPLQSLSGVLVYVLDRYMDTSSNTYSKLDVDMVLDTTSTTTRSCYRCTDVVEVLVSQAT